MTQIVKIKPKSKRYKKSTRAKGFSRKKRILKSKKITFDEPILIRIKRDALGRTIGSKKLKLSKKKMQKIKRIL